MINIRPVSDLRNKYLEIEALVEKGDPVFLTKNGYGKMVVIGIEQYSKMLNTLEDKLDEADRAAETDSSRLDHTSVFERARKAVYENG